MRPPLVILYTDLVKIFRFWTGQHSRNRFWSLKVPVAIESIRMSIRDVLVSDTISESKGKGSARATTLEAHHVQKMKEFTETKQNLANLQTTLEDLEGKIDAIPESAVFSDEWRQLSDQVESTRAQIKSIQADDQRLDYFLNVGDMLFQYFDAHETLAKGVVGPNSKMRMPTNSVLSYFTEASDDSPSAPL